MEETLPHFALGKSANLVVPESCLKGVTAAQAGVPCAVGQTPSTFHELERYICVDETYSSLRSQLLLCCHAL
jgi:hypothetical protein